MVISETFCEGVLMDHGVTDSARSDNDFHQAWYP